MRREAPYQGLTCWQNSLRGEVRKGASTGAAWLSSARAVRRWVKSRNERNPCGRLGCPTRLPRSTWRKGGLTSSQHGSYVLGDPSATMAAPLGGHPGGGS